MNRITGAKPDLKSKKILVPMTPLMKVDVERAALDLGLSEAGFLRLLVRLYFKSPQQLKATDLISVAE